LTVRTKPIGWWAGRPKRRSSPRRRMASSVIAARSTLRLFGDPNDLAGQGSTKRWTRRRRFGDRVDRVASDRVGRNPRANMQADPAAADCALAPRRKAEKEKKRRALLVALEAKRCGRKWRRTARRWFLAEAEHAQGDLGRRSDDGHWADGLLPMRSPSDTQMPQRHRQSRRHSDRNSDRAMRAMSGSGVMSSEDGPGRPNSLTQDSAEVRRALGKCDRPFLIPLACGSSDRFSAERRSGEGRPPKPPRTAARLRPRRRRKPERTGSSKRLDAPCQATRARNIEECAKVRAVVLDAILAKSRPEIAPDDEIRREPASAGRRIGRPKKRPPVTEGAAATGQAARLRRPVARAVAAGVGCRFANADAESSRETHGARWGPCRRRSRASSPGGVKGYRVDEGPADPGGGFMLGEVFGPPLSKRRRGN